MFEEGSRIQNWMKLKLMLAPLALGYPLALGRPEPALTCTSFPKKVLGELKAWHHQSHLAACLDEFNASSTPSGTWCKPSDRANSVDGHTVILEMAIHIVPDNKRELPPALVFCTNSLHQALKHEMKRLFHKYATNRSRRGAVRGWSKLRSTTRTPDVSELLSTPANNLLAVAFPRKVSPEEGGGDGGGDGGGGDGGSGDHGGEEHKLFSLGNSAFGFLQRHWFTLIYSLFLQRLISKAWFLGE